MSHLPLALKLQLYYTKTTTAHPPKDTCTLFPAADQLANVSRHDLLLSSPFYVNIYNFTYQVYFIWRARLEPSVA